MNDNRQKKLIKNSFFFVVGEMSSKVIIFLLVPFYTSFLSTEQYSISDLITTTVTLATPFFTLIISEAVMRFALDKEEDKKGVFSIGIYTCLCGTALLGIISYFVFPYIRLLSDYWLLFVLYFLTFNLYSIITNFLKGINLVKRLAVIGILNTIVLVVANIVFIVWMKTGIQGYLLGTIVANTLATIIAIISTRLTNYILPIWKLPIPLFKRMIRYSLPMMPNSAMWWINNSSDRYLVTYLISNAANGIYSVAYKIPSVFSVIISIFMQAWQISVVDDFATEEGNSFFNSVYSIFVKANILLCAGVILFSKLIGKILYQADFFVAWKLSVILVLGYSFHSLAGFMGTVYTSAKHTKRLFTSTAIAAVCNIFLNIVLIVILKQYGYLPATMGVATATLLSYLISFLIRRVNIKKYIVITVNSRLFLIEYLLLFLLAVLVIFDSAYSFCAGIAIAIILAIINKDMFVHALNVTKKYISRR